MSDTVRRPWDTTEPGRMIGRGHPAGDVLEAWAWELEARTDAHVRVTAHLPARLCNPRGELFGGFTPAYIDLLSVLAVRSRQREAGARPGGLSTVSMRVDYLAPIVGPKFVIDSVLESQRGRTSHLTTRFFQGDQLAVLGATVIVAPPAEQAPEPKP